MSILDKLLKRMRSDDPGLKGSKQLLDQLEDLQELAANLEEIKKQRSILLETNRSKNPIMKLIGRKKVSKFDRKLELALEAFHARLEQKLADFQSAHLSNIEIGRLYERYIGYLYEIDGYHVRYQGALEGLNDLGRDLICTKSDEYLVIQAKCWFRSKLVREKHVYQLHSTMLHQRMTDLRALQAKHSKTKAKEIMKSRNYRALLITTCDISEQAREAAEFLQVEHKKEDLKKEYPMIKCVTFKNGERQFFLPFVRGYDALPNSDTEQIEFRKTLAEAREGFTPAPM